MNYQGNRPSVKEGGGRVGIAFQKRKKKKVQFNACSGRVKGKETIRYKKKTMLRIATGAGGGGGRLSIS